MLKKLGLTNTADLMLRLGVVGEEEVEEEEDVEEDENSGGEVARPREEGDSGEEEVEEEEVAEEPDV